ncbi:MAG TPA: hypothetical protein VGX78_21875 [Pirellulales bacterium]|nr:hypothetical protein [Pirellulales bacterium]
MGQDRGAIAGPPSRVVGLNAADGGKKFDYQARGWIHGVPFVGHDGVFIGSQDRTLHRVDRQ